MKYVSEPVMTVAVEPKRLTDLPRLTEAMNRLSIEDPNLATTINKETGQYLISGMGVLHLEIAVKFLRQYTEGIEITTSNPVAAYRESILKQGAVVMTKSPNKNNRFWIQAEPLENNVSEVMERRDFGNGVERKQSIARSCKEAENLWVFEKNKNMLINTSQEAKGLREVKDSIIAGFQWACRNGPLCGESLSGVKVKLVDAEIHEDQTQREPRQVVRAVSRAILGSCLTANPALLECIYRIEVSVPTQWFGTCANMITRRRGKIQVTDQKGASTVITGYIPVAETLNLSAEMRSATSGHVFWQFTFDHWEKIPEKLVAEVIRRLRQRKGLPPDIPKPEMFVDEVC
jgi:elongation factor 2